MNIVNGINVINHSGKPIKTTKVGKKISLPSSFNMASFTRIVLALIVTKIVFVNCFVPIVLWHGIGDTYLSMGALGVYIKIQLPGVHVVPLKIGSNFIEDSVNSILMHPNKQIEMACQIIKDDPLLSTGFNAVAISQGAALFRGLIQRCPEAKVKTLITMAGQHQGIYGIPFCNPQKSVVCNTIRESLNRLAYLDPLQASLSPATYWHNPLDEQAYKQGSTFLADINNERYINETYKSRLQSLEKFVMVKYSNDEVVIPKESSWFGFYKPGQAVEMQNLQSSDLYIQDRLGLKRMDEDGKLYFLENDWSHISFNPGWFRKNIIDVFLR